MLKKAGIVVAASAASLLALSPLAFAGDQASDHGLSSILGHSSHSGGGDNGGNGGGGNGGGNGGGGADNASGAGDANGGDGDNGDNGGKGGIDQRGGGNGGGGGIDQSAEGFIAGLSGNNIVVPVQVCNNNVGENANVLDRANGALGVLGDATATGPTGKTTPDQSDACAQRSATDTVG